MVEKKMQTKGQTAYSGIEELWMIEKELEGYNKSIINRFKKYLDDKATVLDFGAGIGTLAKIWASSSGKPDCLEIDGNLATIIKDRGFVVYESWSAISKKYDGIYSSNVLEHINDDVATLKEIHSHLKADGVLVIYVPAFMCLFSKMDEVVGHYRRYGRAELQEKLHRAGFRVVASHYVDSLGFFASLALKFFGYRNGVNLGEAGSLRFYDKFIYPVSIFLDWIGFRFLFGKNILIVARKI